MTQKIFTNSLLLCVILSASYRLAAMEISVDKPVFTIEQETNVLFSQESDLVDFLESLLNSSKPVFKLKIKADNAFTISDKTKKLFADAIKSHEELKSLIIEDIILDNNGIAFLAEAIESLRLTVLCLSGAAFDDIGLISLSKLLAHHTSIIELELNNNPAITGKPGIYDFTNKFLYKNKTIRSIKILNCAQVRQGTGATTHFFNSLAKITPPCNLENIELPFPLNDGIVAHLQTNRERVQASIEIRKNQFVVIFCAFHSKDFRQGQDNDLGVVEVLEPEIWSIIVQIFSMLNL